MICVCINDTNFENCKNQARQFKMAEVRIDLCSLDEQQVNEIFSLNKKLIATCRPEIVPDNKRAALLKTAIKSGAAFVDIEFESALGFKKEIIAIAKEFGCEVIISYHNYENTPSAEQLKIIIDQSFSLGADVVKLACMANCMEDNARILSVYEKGKRIVSIGMGKEGKISRIAAPFLGSEFTFASANEEQATAPGQITFDNLNKIYKLIN